MPHTWTSAVILAPLSFLWNVALRIGGDRCVQLLLKHGAKPDAKDHVGVTALIAAVNHCPSTFLQSTLRWSVKPTKFLYEFWLVQLEILEIGISGYSAIAL
jgi:ankyrin repeat protein